VLAPKHREASCGGQARHTEPTTPQQFIKVISGFVIDSKANERVPGTAPDTRKPLNRPIIGSFRFPSYCQTSLHAGDHFAFCISKQLLDNFQKSLHKLADTTISQLRLSQVQKRIGDVWQIPKKQVTFENQGI
jgi:hypothetical protein